MLYWSNVCNRIPPTESKAMKNTHAHMGTRLRELRLARGLQQGEVARRLGRLARLPEPHREGQARRPAAAAVQGARALRQSAWRSSCRASASVASTTASPACSTSRCCARSTSAKRTWRSSAPSRAWRTTITALFNMYKNTRSQLDHLLSPARQARARHDGTELGMSFDYNPFDEVTDFLEANDNWFGFLEERAEQGAPRLQSAAALHERRADRGARAAWASRSSWSRPTTRARSCGAGIPRCPRLDPDVRRCSSSA